MSSKNNKNNLKIIMQEIIIFTNRTLHNAPRVIRQIDFLKDEYKIHTVGYSSPTIKLESFTNIKEFEHAFVIRGILKILRILLNSPFLFRYNKSKEKKINKFVKRIKPKLVFVHDAENLQYFANIKHLYDFKLIFNAHEYYPLEFNERKNWENTWQIYFESIYKEYLPKTDLMINVCESIRQKCLLEFNKDSILIPNAAFYSDISIKNNIKNGKIKIIHHGVALEGRKIEWMIDAVKNAGEKYHLTLMLSNVGSDYYKKLEKLIATISNIELTPPVSFNEIVPSINKYDIGLYLLPPSNFNNSVALPNKIFEFIQAKLCILIGPAIEMEKLVYENNIGLVASENSPEAITKCLLKLDESKILMYKENSALCAKKLSAENYYQNYQNALKAIE
jgi:hypothetical protein